MGHRVIATQPPFLVLVLPVSATRALVVQRDTELLDDDDYAPGVMRALEQAWNADDYFAVTLVDERGKTVEHVGSMAGYGSPRKAALAAARDYFGLDI